VDWSRHRECHNHGGKLRSTGAALQASFCTSMNLCQDDGAWLPTPPLVLRAWLGPALSGVLFRRTNGRRCRATACQRFEARPLALPGYPPGDSVLHPLVR
jgi:hypothetical protein